MHTNATLDILDDQTTALGNQLRYFQSKICPQYQTRELRREADARKRRQHNQGLNISSSVSAVGQQDLDSRRPKTLNLQTYKYHALGDYVETIKRLGTTDSYTSEAVRKLILLLMLNDYILSG